MFDVVTDIPAQTEIAAFTVPFGHVAGGRFSADARDTRVRGTVREALAQPGQMVGLGQGLAYLDRVAPIGSDALSRTI